MTVLMTVLLTVLVTVLMTVLMTVLTTVLCTGSRILPQKFDNKNFNPSWLIRK
jgi:hypothetical protein